MSGELVTRVMPIFMLSPVPERVFQTLRESLVIFARPGGSVTQSTDGVPSMLLATSCFEVGLVASSLQNRVSIFSIQPVPPGRAPVRTIHDGRNGQTR
jgi:hypothetical protein